MQESFVAFPVYVLKTGFSQSIKAREQEYSELLLATVRITHQENQNVPLSLFLGLSGFSDLFCSSG